MTSYEIGKAALAAGGHEALKDVLRAEGIPVSAGTVRGRIEFSNQMSDADAAPFLATQVADTPLFSMDDPPVYFGPDGSCWKLTKSGFPGEWELAGLYGRIGRASS